MERVHVDLGDCRGAVLNLNRMAWRCSLLTIQADYNSNMDGSEPEIHCPKCGYDLKGLREDRCPECGTAFDRVHLEGMQRKYPGDFVISEVVVGRVLLAIAFLMMLGGTILMFAGQPVGLRTLVTGCVLLFIWVVVT